MDREPRARIFLRGIPADELVWTLARQTPTMVDGCYRGVRFVTDDSYDHAIMLNEGFDVRSPARHNACFLMEPPDKFRPQPHPSIGTMFSFNPDDRPVFGDRYVHQHMLSFLHTGVLVADEPAPAQKPRFMSMVVSGKVELPFQAKRLELAEALLASDLSIDFYGRDWRPQAGEPRIKGPLPRIDKTAALRDYSCSLALENSPQDGYLTEKFVDCLANNCIPITNNRTPFGRFPNNSFIYLDFTLPISELVARIRDLDQDRRWIQSVRIQEAKRQVLSGDWSFAEAIVRFIAGCSAQTGAFSRPSQRPSALSPTHGSAMSTRPTTGVVSSSPEKTASVSQPVLSVLFLSCRRLHYLRRTVEAIRRHLQEVEPEITTAFLALDNGSSPEDRVELVGMGFDLLTLAGTNLGIGPAMNHLVSQVRTPFLLNLQDDWEVTNPHGRPFIREAIAIMKADQRIAHVKLDNCHFLDFSDRATYDGPIQATQESVKFFVQNPGMMWGGFSFPPALTRTAVLHELGPFREDCPFRRGWAESEYTQRYATKFVAAKSPDLLVFTHIGIEPSKGWQGEGAGAAVPKPTVAFIIPYREDTPDRAQNLYLTLRYLEHHIKTQGWKATVHVQQPSPEEAGAPFWKARLINDAVRQSEAEIIGIIDADVLVPPEQMSQAIAYLAVTGDFCYPYEGEFLNVPRIYIPRLLGDFQVEALPRERFDNMNPASVGGAVLFRRSVFWAGGGMNEHFRSWGREDAEVYDRFIKLGYGCRRIHGPVFHLDHARTVDSNPGHPHHSANIAEYERIMALDPHQLLEEVSTWAWVNA